MLFRSIAAFSLEGSNVLIRNIVEVGKQYAWDLNALDTQNGMVYKTHDYPPRTSTRTDTKFVYVFVDPVDVVTSLIRLIAISEWNKERLARHCAHLRVPYVDVHSLIHVDYLCLEQHFDAWLTEDRFPIAFVRYEHTWEQVNELSLFLGMPITLPSFRKRQKTENILEPTMLTQIEKTYASLREKVYRGDGFFVRNTRHT